MKTMSKLQAYKYSNVKKDNPLLGELYKLSFSNNMERYDFNKILTAVRYKLSNPGFSSEYKSSWYETMLGVDNLKLKLERYGNDGGWAERESERILSRIFSNKSPFSDDEWLSVEIECIIPNQNIENVTRDIAKSFKRAGISRHVTIKDDGSLYADCNRCESRDDSCECGDDSEVNDAGKEFVVSFPIDRFDILKTACDILNDEYNVYINNSCGLHVHFDFRKYSSRQAIAKAKRLVPWVSHLKKMLPMSRRSNQFCRHDISTNGDRYSFINTLAYDRHKTIEIRGHSGTTNYSKIYSWIMILKLLMEKSAVDIEITEKLNFTDMLAHAGCEGDYSWLYDYCMARYKKFNDSASDDAREVAISDKNPSELYRGVERIADQSFYSTEAMQYELNREIPILIEPSTNIGIDYIQPTPYYTQFVNQSNATRLREQMIQEQRYITPSCRCAPPLCINCDASYRIDLECEARLSQDRMDEINCSYVFNHDITEINNENNTERTA